MKIDEQLKIKCLGGKDTRSHKHISYISKNGEIIPQTIRINEWYYHAEQRALKAYAKYLCRRSKSSERFWRFYPPRGWNNIKKKGLVIHSLRYNSKGLLKNAKPCIKCLGTIKLWEIPRVEYSSDGGLKINEKTLNIYTNHVSRFYK